MNVMAFYLGALGLVGLAAILIRKTSAHTRAGGAQYERRRARRFMGQILLVPAAFLLGLAVFTQISSSHAPVAVSSALSGGADQRKNAPPGSSALAQDLPLQSPPDPVTAGLMEAVRLQEQDKLDDALAKVNAVIRSVPRNANAFSLRGNIYAEKKLWDQAGQDYRSALQFDGGNVQAKFNLAEIDFIDKKYDDARPAFLALTEDSTMGDLASYKVFLCDLFGGHKSVATSELDAFNQVGSNASYYFANVAWSIYHKKTADARSWLGSARRIYPLNKFNLYAASLRDLGYLPLPPPSASGP